MKRREFIAGTTALLAGSIPSIGRSEAKPCPPPGVFVAGGTTVDAQCGADNTTSPVWLRDKPVGQWFEVPGTKLSSCPPTVTPKFGNPKAKINAWNGAALRHKNSVYLIGACGGHADYAGNEVNGLTLASDTPRWVELRPSSEYADMVNGSTLYLDFRRSAVHTYQSIVFNQQDDRLIIPPSGGMYAPSVLPNAPSQWSARAPVESLMASFTAVNWSASDARNDWDAASFKMSHDSGETPVNGHYRSVTLWPTSHVSYPQACCIHPTTGDIFIADSTYKLYKYKRSTNSWSVINDKFAYGLYSYVCADPVRSKILCLGSQAQPYLYLADTATGEVSAVSTTGLDPSVLYLPTGGPVNYEGHSSLMYDDANDRFILARDNSAMIRYGASGADRSKPFQLFSIKNTGGLTYHISEIPLVAVAGSTIPDFVGDLKLGHEYRRGIHSAMRYVPELKGLVVADQYDDNVHFMRVA